MIFLFPFVYVLSFFYAIVRLFKKKIDGFLIFIVCGLPIYINALSVSFLFGLGKWIPYLQSLKEIAVMATFFVVIREINKRPVFHLIDKLVIVFFAYTFLYVLFPIGPFALFYKLLAFKNLSFFCLLYVIGRLCKTELVYINKLFSFIVIVIIVAAVVSITERISYQHLQSFTGFADYNFYFFNAEASGNYGLLWTFETESGAKRFGSIFSNPLDLAASTVLCLGILFGLITHKNKAVTIRPNNFEIVGLVATVICILLAASRASFLSYFVLIYIYGWVINNKKIIKLFHVFAFLILYYVFFILEGDLYNFIMNTITFRNESSLGHVIEWIDGINAMVAHPLGMGLGQSGRVTMVNNENTGGENQFIIIGVQAGVIAMFLYIGLYYQILKTGLRELKQSVGKEWKVILSILLIKIGLFIPMFTAYIDSYIYVSYISWFLTGYMVNMIQTRKAIVA